MHKIINSAFVSLDGVTEDPRSWAIPAPGSLGKAAQVLQALDGMLMGRGTYESQLSGKTRRGHKPTIVCQSARWLVTERPVSRWS